MNEENLKEGIAETSEPEEEGHTLGRREVIKVGAAVAGGLALGMGTYVKPGMVSVGVGESYAYTTGGSGNPYHCTIGYWFNSPFGSSLWDGGGEEWYDSLALPSGTLPVEYEGMGPAWGQPFSALTRFNDFFFSYSPFSDHKMGDFAAKFDGATPQSQNAAHQAIAAVLNASWFGWTSPKSIADIKQMWEDAAKANTDAAFAALTTALTALNEGSPGSVCPLPGNDPQ